LNALGSGAAQLWDTMDRRPIFRKMAFGVFVLLLLAVLWFFFGPRTLLG